jgi:hypothetical protein
LARYVTALVGVGLEVTRLDTFNDYRTLIASSATFDKHVNPLLKEARAILRREWQALVASKGAVQPEYNLARDERAWVLMSESMRESALVELTGA